MIKVLVFFVVGFVEMFIATQRMYWIAKGKSLAAALLVFFENAIYLFIIAEMVKGVNLWYVIIAYALGSAIGTYINLEKFPY
jgi:uncharacterized protein YebE (UPF0316 family)